MDHDDDQVYCNRIVAEASGPGGKLYQRVIFEQHYDDNAVQVSEQQRLFPAVAAAVTQVSLEFGEEDMKRRGKPLKK